MDDAKDNPFFAKALVNRYWKHFFNRGLVDPEDDMRETNPPTNPELLEALAKNFIESRLRFERPGANDLPFASLSTQFGARTNSTRWINKTSPVIIPSA